ncbi:MAG: lysophospholipid acyltransferase family protein, partial [Myxococcaceae bacterium]
SDPFLIAHLPWQMKFLAKASLFKIPLIGWGLWLAGDVAVKRGTPESVREAMEECARWLEKGMAVMVFPEGKRSDTDELLPFKDGAFRLAIETGADVLPVAVRGTRKAMPMGGWRFGRSKALVTVGTPLSTRGLTLADVEPLKAQARAQIEALRASLDPLVAPAT